MEPMFPIVDMGFYKEKGVGFSYYDCLMGNIILVKKYNNVGFPLIYSKKNDYAIAYDVYNNCLTIPSNFVYHFFQCKSNVDIRFIVINLSLIYRFSKNNSIYTTIHANSILYDRNDNSIELFEPNGPLHRQIETYETQTTLDIDEHIFQTKLIEFCLNELKVDKVYFPKDYNANKNGLHSLQYDKTKTNHLGFCGPWSIWWLEYRLLNSHLNLSRKELFDYAFNKVSSLDICYTKYIVAYANEIIIKWYDQLLKVILSIDEFRHKFINKVKEINMLFDSKYDNNNVVSIQKIKWEIEATINPRMIYHLVKYIKFETSNISAQIDYL
jgi:hypothetical protein